MFTGEKPFITAPYARQRKEQGKARAPIPQSCFTPLGYSSELHFSSIKLKSNAVFIIELLSCSQKGLKVIRVNVIQTHQVCPFEEFS